MPWESGLQPDPIQIIEAGILPPPAEALSLLGGKAFNLVVLAAMGLPVPPGFVLPTSLCAQWIADGPPPMDEFRARVAGPLSRLEQATGLAFGDARRPLLVSVRSGPPISMPGMLDTILNVGLTRATLPGMMALTGDPRLVWDCYARLVRSYGQVVHGLDPAPFEDASAGALLAGQAGSLSDLDTLSLRGLASRYLDIFEDLSGRAFPDTPMEQLLLSVDAVFRSWESERAKTYRRIRSLTDQPGTAVTVQRMVYGNSGPKSGSGVGFTRDPATGEKRLYLDFSFDAQGDDVVSGRRRVTPAITLSRIMPQVAQGLEHVARQMEDRFHDMQDFEFTVEDGRLFLLQTRAGKRSAWARLKIAVDMVREGLIGVEEALRQLDGLDYAAITRRRVVGVHGDAIAKGTPAGIGAATGAIVMSADVARQFARQGRPAILVSNDLLTEDIEGIASAEGLLAAHGGRTSHAAVVARELGKVAIVGCADLVVAPDRKNCVIAGRRFDSGAEITLDGESGSIYEGRITIDEVRPYDELATVESWMRAGPGMPPGIALPSG